MADVLARAEPVTTTPFAGLGVTISLAPPMSRYSLRARAPETLEALLGFALPRTIGACRDGVACLGPDEWLYRSVAPIGPWPDAGQALAIVDCSDRAVCLIIEGPRAAQLLMSGCPLDLDRLGVGRATRTIYETVEIVVIRESETLFHVEVWRSFAPWLWTALTTASLY